MNVLSVFSHQGKSPKIHKEAMISPLATLIGDVEIGEGSSVFPGAVLRGDLAKIIVGKYSNIQDNVVLHAGELRERDKVTYLPVEIGNYVTVAHAAVVHGSKIGDVTLIGIGAMIHSSIVGEGSIIGINATVLENTTIPKRSVVVGVPAKVIKTVDDETYSIIKKHALKYYNLASSHKGQIF